MITRNEIYRFYTEFEIINYLIVSNVGEIVYKFNLCAKRSFMNAETNHMGRTEVDLLTNDQAMRSMTTE